MSEMFNKLRIKAIRKVLRLLSNRDIMEDATAVRRIKKVTETKEGDFGALDRLSKGPRIVARPFHIGLGGCTVRLVAAI